MTDCCHFLIEQHAETRRLLATLEEHLQEHLKGRGSFAAIEAMVAALVVDLKQHFVLEEQGLFETVNQYRSMMLMEVEHDDLLQLQRSMRDAIDACVHQSKLSETAFASFAAFRERLLAHMVEEESGIFPKVKEWLEPEEHHKVLRRYAELQESLQAHPSELKRPPVEVDVKMTSVFQPVSRPIGYETLYEQEHNSVQHLMLQTGQSLAMHWAGQHQGILLVSGKVILSRPDKVTDTLTPGGFAKVGSRTVFSLQALMDSHLLVFKVWPHPHFTKG